ncbi:hypothetical protein MIMGU_mgv1a0089182mg, partial [Erythranthe guttata]
MSAYKPLVDDISIV